MKRPYIVITAAENGWIVTMDEDLFSAAIATDAPRPMWVFTSLGALSRFIRNEGFKLTRRITIPRPTVKIEAEFPTP